MRQSMYKSFGTDGESEVNGIWLEYTGFRILVARAGGANKRYTKAINAESKPLERIIATGNLEDKQAMDILKRVFSKHVVRNWEVDVSEDEAVVQWVKGIEPPADYDTGLDDHGLMPMTAENIVTTFNALDDLWVDVLEQARKGSLYRQSLREEALGNS